MTTEKLAMKAEGRDTFAAKVWETLSCIDVTPHIEYMRSTGNRPAMRYLPWHKAWAMVKELYPASDYMHGDDVIHPDGTMEVEVVVFIRGDEVTNTSRCRLAVMDSKYNAIPNPNARDINDGRQRALVKALAFAGLGLNLWSDSDIPVGKQGKTVTEEQAVEIMELIKSTGSDLTKFLKWSGVDHIEALPYEKYRMAVDKLNQKAQS